VPARNVLARADPDRARVVRVDGHAAYGIGVFIVEDRRPGRAAVFGLPDSATANADVPGALSFGVDGDVRDTAGHEGRADAAKFEALEGCLIEAGVGFFVVGGEYGGGGQC